MTQPVPPRASGRGPEVNINGQVVPGPDGKAWVLLQILVGQNAALTMVISDAVATDLAPIFEPVLRQAADAARQANMGLIVPPNGSVPPGTVPLRPPNPRTGP